MAGLYGSSEWLLPAMQKTAGGRLYEYGYYADYPERAVFDGNTRFA